MTMLSAPREIGRADSQGHPVTSVAAAVGRALLPVRRGARVGFEFAGR